MEMILKFKNPKNDCVRAITPFSIILCALFGPLYFLVMGNWLHAILFLLAGIFTILAFGYPYSAFLYPLFVYPINKDHYLSNGWVQIDKTKI